MATIMPVLTFGLAVNERQKSKNGEWEDYINWIDCTMFGKRADSVKKWLEKGKKVFVDGKLRYSSWEKDGQRRSKIEVIVDDIDFGLTTEPKASRVQESSYDDIPF